MLELELELRLLLRDEPLELRLPEERVLEEPEERLELPLELWLELDRDPELELWLLLPELCEEDLEELRDEDE